MKTLTDRQRELDAVLAANPNAIAFAGVYTYPTADGGTKDVEEDTLVCSNCASSYVHAQPDDELLPDKLAPISQDEIDRRLIEDERLANDGVCSECEDRQYGEHVERILWRRDHPFTPFPGDEPEEEQ